MEPRIRSTGWSDIFGHVQQMQLQRLEVGVSIIQDDVEDGPPLNVIPRLTCLTRLDLHGRFFLRSESSEFSSLACLSQLRMLSLIWDNALSISQSNPESGELEAALISRITALSCLTFLGLSGDRLPEAFGQFAEAGGLQGAWPALHTLDFPFQHHGRPLPMPVLTVLAREACTHPSIRRLVLDIGSDRLFCKADDVFEDDFVDVRCEMARITAGTKVQVQYVPCTEEDHDEEQ